MPESVAEVTRVAIEWAPEPASDYLGDRTAFDAFVEYRTQEGDLCALGIETKLTEPFSQKVYDGESYRRWMNAADGIWRPEAGAQVQRIEHNQLWRYHVLSVALGHHPRSPYAYTRLLVVHHPQDPDCRDTFDGYRALLRTEDVSLAVRDLESLVAAWSRLVTETAHAAWLNAFHLRYVDLEPSDAERM